MHGRVQNYGDSCRSLRRISTQHMRSVLPLATTTKKTVADRHCSLPSPVSTSTVTDSSFVKDGRQINIGDCALFKPPQDCPPFIGLIRSLRLSKDNNLQLVVNWLYRPSELKLGKGTVIESAPNEIFYSFHKDETPAASLLHPCKVAFLPRGVELPTGTSSFVCRRVYDIANKCLWWLTDQNFIDERQEEVDQLLYKTKTEMHATLQPDGRSPKQVNGPNSTSQLKPASDSGQNSGSFPSQVKGKKRERVDHGSDPVKRGRSSRTDGGDSHNQKSESTLKLEIARITEKGGLVNPEGVDKLVQLMQPDRTERKMELGSRSMLASVMAATEKDDCLKRFVQLRGLPILDEWLQDIHKGKLGDGYSSKDGDKFVEEFLLVLLRALDKLPVNLHALQMCNIGRSVNHLRSHKNSEIQRKARGLVDLWKKRVEAEMISIDAKSNSTHTAAWPSKSRQPEASHGGSRTPSGSDVGIKSSITQNSASKTTSARSSHGENNMKSATSSSPGPGKPALSAAPKENQPRISIGDAPVIREDRSSSSNQSHNYSQTSSGKEDCKTSAAGSAAVSKISNSGTRNRRSSGFPTSATGSQKEASSIRSSSAQRTAAPEKLTQPGFNSDRVIEGPITEGNGPKLIVKIPNRVHSPAQGVGVGSLEDPAFMSSRVSSPILTDKHEQSDHAQLHKSDKNRTVASDTNVVLGPCQNNVKNVPTGSAEGVGLSAASDDEHRMTIEDPRRSMDAPPAKQWSSGKLHASSFSPMNALVESCAKYSEANSSMSLEDEVGMNLLASVAAGEISRGNLVSPTDSSERSIPAVDGVCNGDEAKSKPSPEDNMVRVRSDHDSECHKNNHAAVDGRSQPENGVSVSKYAANGTPGDKIFDIHNTSGDVQGGERYKQFVSPNTHCTSETDAVVEADRSNEKSSSLSLHTSGEKVRDVNSNEAIRNKSILCTVSRDGVSNCKSGGFCVTKVEEKTSTGVFTDKDKQTGEAEISNQHAAGVFQSRSTGESSISSPKKCNSVLVKDEFTELSGKEKLQPTVCGEDESGAVAKIGEIAGDIKGCINKSDEENNNSELDERAAGNDHGVTDFCSTSDDAKNHQKEDHIEVHGKPSEISDPGKESPSSIYNQLEKKVEMKESGSTCNKLDEIVDCVADASSSAAEVSDLDSKVKFDLNEGFNVDDGKYGDSVNVPSPVAANVNVLSASFPVTSTPSSNPASITVAAPAKGPFVPPEDLLRIKGELGWKGSAATSAFRPAEPRKVDAPLVSATSPETSTSKRCRVPLDIDLNVPDERVLEEMASREFALAVESKNDSVANCPKSLNEGQISVPIRTSTRLDFDLNTVDEANDIGYCSTSTNHKGEGSAAPVKLSGPLPSVDVRRDFDLNNGPGVDDTIIEQFQINQQMKEGVPPQLSSAGLRVNNPGLGNISSWFLPGSTYSTVAVPSMLPDRGEQRFSIFPSGTQQRPFGPSGVNSFTPDVYRGSVLSSSPAMPLQPSPFQFSMYPYGATYPLSSATYPVPATSYADSVSGPRLFAPQMTPQFQVPLASLPSQFQRPFKVNLPDNRSNDGSENNRRWGRQGLDLNSGPGIMESDVREENIPPASGQHSIASSQALAEEHARMYSVSGGTLKRKEPEGSWENEFRYKQSSWQ